MGTVRQIEAGDELSGSIINPHPLLFNILRTPTAHTEQSSSSLQRYQSAPTLKSSAASQSSSNELPPCILLHFSVQEAKTLGPAERQS